METLVNNTPGNLSLTPTHDYLTMQVASVWYSLFIICFAITTNSIFFVVIYKHNEFQTSGFAMAVSICCAELFFMLGATLYEALWKLCQLYGLITTNQQSEILNQVMLGTKAVGSLLIPIQLLAVTFQRFYSVFRPDQFRKTFNQRNTALLIILCWSLAVVGSVVAIGTNPSHHTYLFVLDTFEMQYTRTPRMYIVGFSTVLCLSLAIPFYIALLFRMRSSAALADHLRLRQSERAKRRRENSLTIVFFVVLIWFTACYIGSLASIIFPQEWQKTWIREIRFGTLVMWTLNYSVDTVFYMTLNKRVRVKVVQLLCKRYGNKIQPDMQMTDHNATSQPSAMQEAPIFDHVGNAIIHHM